MKRSSIKNKSKIFLREKKEQARQWYKETFIEKESASLYKKYPVKLNQVQRKIVDELNEKGISVIDINNLFPEGNWWNNLKSEADKFVNSNELRSYVNAFKHELDSDGLIPEGHAKKYLYRKYLKSKVVEIADDILAQFGISKEMLEIIASYLGRYPKLRMVDMWYNIAAGTEKIPVLSQNWHRDGEDSELVKVFLYFNDIDETAGPFTFIPETHSKGKYAEVFPAENKTTNRYGGCYPSNESINEKFAEGQIKVCTAPKATLIFCDTNGIHRGGFCTLKDRILGNWVYTTPSSFADNVTQFKNNRGMTISETQKFALSIK